MSWTTSLTSPAANATGVSASPLLEWTKAEASSGGNPIAIDLGTQIASPNTKQAVLSDGNSWNQINPGTYVEADTEKIVTDAVDETNASTGIQINPYGWADRMDTGLAPTQANSEIPNLVVGTAVQAYYQATAYVGFSGLNPGDQFDFYIYGGKDTTYSSSYTVTESGNSTNVITIDAKGTLPPTLVTDLNKITCTADSNGKILLVFYATDIIFLNAIYMYPANAGGSAEPASMVTVSENSDLSAPTEQQSVATALQYQVTSVLTENTDYFWGVSIDGGSTYSEINKFTTVNNNPFTAPTLVSPADNAVGQSLFPVLSWVKTDAATLFDIDISLTPTFSGVANTDFFRWSAQSGETFTVQNTLIRNTKYYWRVRSTDNTTYASQWSDVFNFTTQYGIPSAPVLTSPSNNEAGVSITNTFIWTNGGGADTYDLYVSTNSSFPDGVTTAGLTGTSFDSTSLSLLNSKGYYWKVIAKNSYGTSESAVNSFITADPNVPSPPTLKSPVNGATDIYVRPSFEWNASAGATNYDVEIADNSGFTNSTLHQGNSGTVVTFTDFLKTGTPYYWRVRASNGNGTGQWGDVSNFTTQAKQSANLPTLTSPSNNATSVGFKPQLDWDWTGASASSGTNYGALPDVATRSIQTIVVRLSAPATVFNVTKATLKYNKTFAASYSGDDSMQADMDSFQQNIRDGGASYTDGCGNSIPFGLDFANFCVNTQNPPFDFHTEDDTWSSAWYSWSQMAEAYQWGSGIFSHGYQDPIGWGGSIEYDALKSKAQMYKQLMKRPGFEGGVTNGVDEQYFCAPDSNVAYYPDVIKPIGQYNPFKAFLSETTTDGFVGNPDGVDVSAYSDSSLLTKLYRSFSSGAAWLSDAKSKSINGKAYWVLYGGHGVSAGHIQDALSYGATGTDDILFASAQEVLDYIDVKGSVTVTNDLGNTGNDSIVTITLDTTNVPNDLRFYGLTLLIDTDVSIQSIEVNGGVTTGNRKNSSVITGQSAMVNVHWNGKDYLTRKQIAQRWVDWAISKGSDANANNIAQDYIDCVPTGADRTSLLAQLSLSDSGWKPGSVLADAGINYDPENLPMKYDLQVALSAYPTNALIDIPGITTKSYALQTALQANNDYIWKVRADNEVYDSAWSDTFGFSTINGTPSAPTIISPGDASQGLGTSVSLQWTGDNNATGYEVQISTDANFTNILTDVTGVFSPYVVSSLGYNTQYYWRVRETNTVGTSNWTSASFKVKLPPVPAAPTYLNPVSGANDIPILGQTLQWQLENETSNYDAEVRISNPGQSNDNQLIDSISSDSDTSFIISTSLAYSTVYKWRVRGNNAGGSGDWGSYWYFTTVAPPPPGKVTIELPVNNKVSTSIAPLFTWDSIGNASYYKFEIATNQNDFSNTVIHTFDHITGISFDFSNNNTVLEYSTDYYWRVTAFNNSGQGEPSDIFTFKTADIPKPVKITGGTPTGSNVLIKPNFTWDADTEATSYHLTITRTSDNVIILNDSTISGNSFLLQSNLSYATAYSWSVSGINSSGEGEAGTFALTTENAPVPAKPNLLKPLNNSNGESVLPVLTWDLASNSDSYSIEIAIDSGFTNVIDNGTETSGQYVLSTDLDYLTQYFWRVKGVNAYGAGEWSDIFDFTTEMRLSAPELLYPEIYDFGINEYPVLKWYSVNNASYYTLDISNAPDFSNIVFTKTNITESQVKSDTKLDYEESYYWRVRATRLLSDGTTEESPISSFRMFTVREQPIPSPINITSPKDNDVLSKNPIISFTEDDNAYSYQIQIDKKASFVTAVYDFITKKTDEPANLNYATKYYVRVRGIGDAGIGDWSETIPFKTEILSNNQIPTEMDLLLKATFDLNLKVVSITDLIGSDYNTVHQLQLSDIKGIFKISLPTGVIYQNPGWDEDDYSNADVSGESNTWQKGSIPLPKDIKGNVLLGDYLIEYKVTADGSGNTTYEASYTYSHLFVLPEGGIDVIVNIANSSMMVEDVTNYTVTVDGVRFAPTNDLTAGDRGVTVRYPLGSNKNNVFSSDISFEVSPLWTGDYDIYLKSNVNYSLKSDSANLSIVISGLVDMLKGDINVEQFDCTSIVLTCMEKITANYERNKINNIRLAQSLKGLLDEIMVYYNMYEMAIKTGSETEYACSKLKALLQTAGCLTDYESDSISKQIIPKN